jgi:hypothetical protein
MTTLDVQKFKFVCEACRTPNVDLTPRIKPFVQPTGIDIPDVELPVGDHMSAARALF